MEDAEPVLVSESVPLIEPVPKSESVSEAPLPVREDDVLIMEDPAQERQGKGSASQRPSNMEPLSDEAIILAEINEENKEELQILIRTLTNRAETTLPFFAVWGQESCFVLENLYRSNNPNVQAMFKPLAKMSFEFECDPRRTILIDDSSYKGCVSPANNCIFPMMFDEKKKMDRVLMGELLPYLLKLDEARDVRTAIECERYGQPPISNDSKYDAITAY
ncbi:hypothetical protein L7F22_054483 [Adiantum nelumboides]|nr:hypothetical protein [Adiantum nelumboides]